MFKVQGCFGVTFNIFHSRLIIQHLAFYIAQSF